MILQATFLVESLRKPEWLLLLKINDLHAKDPYMSGFHGFGEYHHGTEGGKMGPEALCGLCHGQ
jgi:hypothetical protein